jgi:DNA-binding response OmpR family regulator
LADTLQRILLVDDDPLFGRIFKQEAKKQNIAVVVCISLENPELLRGQVFDAAVVDYDLGGMTGPELSEYLAAILGSIPVLLISAKDRPEVPIPLGCLVGFVHKGKGNQAILDSLSQFHSLKST